MAFDASVTGPLATKQFQRIDDPIFNIWYVGFYLYKMTDFRLSWEHWVGIPTGWDANPL